MSSYEPTYEPTGAPPADRRVKVPHLVFGLLFLGLAGVWGLVEGGVITSDRLPILGPAVLITAGVLGLVASLANSRNRRVPAPYPSSSGVPDDADDTDDTEEIR